MASSSNKPTSAPLSPNVPTLPSSPTTLSSKSSSDKSDSGILNIKTGFYNNEPLNAYRPGGLHPVHFGDLLHHGRYMIVRKLGYGAFSTVWLAKDTLDSHYVAIKIKTAETSVDTSELSILSYLKQQGNSDLRSKYIITILGYFEHQGPNGKHVCIVSEALSASISNVLHTCSEYSHGARTFFPKWMVKRILRQVLIGICFLHSHGVIHGDLHLGNILFAEPGPDSYTVEELEHDETMEDLVITRPNGALDKCAPRYIAETSPLIEHFCDGPDLTVKVSDLGAAYKFEDRSKNPKTTEDLHAPERIFNSPLDQSIDIWGFGCIVFELLTGVPLPDENDDSHILMVTGQLGPLPGRSHSQWDQSHQYFRSNGEQFNSMVDGPDIELLPHVSFETLFRSENRCKLDANEEESVIDMLKQTLRCEPEKRPSAEELLSHPWFADIGT